MNKKSSKMFEGALFEFQERFKDITEEDLNSALNNFIYSNDEISAKNLILYINWCFENASSPNASILEGFISHAFKNVVQNGLTLDQAFCFSKARGQYERPDHFERDLEAALRVILLMRQGKKYLYAIEEVAGILCPDGQGDRTIKDAYDFYKNYYSHNSDDELKGLINALSSERL